MLANLTHGGGVIPASTQLGKNRLDLVETGHPTHLDDAFLDVLRRGPLGMFLDPLRHATIFRWPGLSLKPVAHQRG